MLTLAEGARVVVNRCARVRPGEAVVVVFDALRPESVAIAIAKEAESQGAQVKVVQSDIKGVSGADLGPEAAHAVSQADLVFGVTTNSVSHTSAARAAAKRGARILSLTGCTEGTLTSGGIEADFEAIAPRCEELAQRLSHASIIDIWTAIGTEYHAVLVGRSGRPNTGILSRQGMIGGCPNIEAYIAPLEDSSHGRLVFDGSGTNLGVLSEPITISVIDGRVVSIGGGSQADEVRRRIEAAGRGGDVLAEIGFGLNPCAQVIGSIIEDEGALGTAHFAFGSNETFGGANRVDFHLDLVYWKPTVRLDGVLVMDDGVLV